MIVVVAVIVIGPKDMPRALRTAGGWIGKVRKVSAHFRSGIDTMIREAELEDMEKKWKAQNEAVMAKAPGVDAESALLNADDPVPDMGDEMTGPYASPEDGGQPDESDLGGSASNPSHPDDPKG